jgi:hypothetical protein
MKFDKENGIIIQIGDVLENKKGDKLFTDRIRTKIE